MATPAPRAGEKRNAETEAICSASKKQKLGDGIENEDSIVHQEGSGPFVRKLETSELAGTERANDLLRNTIFGKYLETVEVTAGPSRTLYTLHVRVLQDRCPGLWQLVDMHGRAHSGHAAGQRLYHFAGDVDIIFKLFVAWMYTGAVPTRLLFRGEDTEAVEFEKMQPRGRLVNSKSAASDVDEFGDFCLVQLFYFGTFHEVLDLSNAALSSLAARNERRHCTIAASAVQHAYVMSGHQTSCNLLDFLVEDSARRLKGDNLEPSIVNFPGTFVQRVLKRTMGRKVSKAASIPATQWPRRVCEYHFHTEPGMVSPCINKCLLPMDVAITSSTACYDLESTAFVSIGPEAVLFAAHEQKLCQVSEYFQKALCGAFVEGNSKIIHLPEERVADFGLFLDWLYTGKLTFPECREYAMYRDYLKGPRNSNGEHAEGDVGARAADSEVLRIRDRQDSESSLSESDSDEEDEDEDEDQDDSDDDSEDEEEVADTIAEPSNRSASMQKRINHDKWRFREILNLYIFADRRGVPALQNDIIDLIAKWRESGWSHMSSYLDLVSIAYENLPAKSTMLKYLVDEAAFCWNDKLGTLNDLDQYPKAFIAAAMRDMIKYGQHQTRGSGDEEWFGADWREDICRLHEHANDAERDQCKERHRVWHEEMAEKDEKGGGMEPVRALP
ncbi:hypothetical protein LTS10_012115 [Elasticomyces elasticus]|nr:hypothetical protein LTS10_012115 [Elasticomyces elasticus]